ncbi:MAG TPA: hypothetical protein PKE07_07790 [Lacibacter sp.]|nr:hypothetical protein [Lacibacter sp.]HMO90491.1 hypothetical protein [Lacibacter sp.]
MKKISFEKLIYITLVIIVISYIIFKLVLDISGSYTICKIDMVNSARGGTNISYSFIYNGKEYYGNISKPFRKENEGRYFFVKFWKVIPRVNLLQTDYPADSCASKYQNIVLDKIPDCK